MLLGELLVAGGLITQEDATEALMRQRQQGGRALRRE